MNTNNLNAKLAAARAKLAKLEAEAAKARSRELALLPKKLGFSDVNALIVALRNLGKAKINVASAKFESAKTSVATSKRKRGKVTEETRMELKKMVEAGKTGVEIAKALKVSLPTVQNIKKALGLVRTTKKKRAGTANKPVAKAKVTDTKPTK